MNDFTDLLDEYLAASQAVREAREKYTGYEFGYFYYKEIDREDRARTALNSAFVILAKGPTT
jgi:hypothetical protein